jgi:hypothetical protein
MVQVRLVYLPEELILDSMFSGLYVGMIVWISKITVSGNWLSVFPMTLIGKSVGVRFYVSHAV